MVDVLRVFSLILPMLLLGAFYFEFSWNAFYWWVLEILEKIIKPVIERKFKEREIK